MTLILCADDRGGLLFHNRRQSQDREVRADMLREAGAGSLWMDAYSLGQFAGPEREKIQVAEDLLRCAGREDSVFLERQEVRPFLAAAQRMVVYRWGRCYPSDRRILLPPEGWRLADREEFSGYSHSTITKEVYIR